MRAALPLLPFLFALALPACAAEPTATPEQAAAPAPKPVAEAAPKANENAAKPLDKKQFGAPISEAKTTSLAEIMKEPAKYNGQTVRTEGTVTAVCKSMGCWMEIGDANGTAHIKMAGHSFFVPKTASGRRAVVQGKLLGAAEEGNTCASQDGCREAHEKESGRLAKVEMEATGVEFVD